MILPDVNVLVYAHREDAVDHARYRQWLEEKKFPSLRWRHPITGNASK